MLGINASLGRVLIPKTTGRRASGRGHQRQYWRGSIWQRREVIGKVVSANNVQVTIVGVLPAAFTGVQQPIGEPSDISFPVSLDPQLTGAPPGGGPPRLNQPTWWWLQVMGRLKPGATAAQVAGNLAGVFQGTAKAGLDSYLTGLNDSQRSLASNQNRTAVPRFSPSRAAGASTT